ncbi:MAG TPA: FHA domain-containing protein [Anaerolineales bacterium]|nr:FHA domain-containing protein [Anaerolineales bacterium]
MDTSERFCYVCQNKNEPEAIICVYCGASLDKGKFSTTRKAEIKINYSEKPEDLSIDEAVIPKEGIAVYFAETTKPFVIQTDKEFIIGRKVIETTESMLDLSDFDGFKMGLSRRHAMIRQAESGYEIIDLSSTNGTWLNDERLVPYTPYPLASGSRLRLSRIRLFVFYRTMTENK